MSMMVLDALSSIGDKLDSQVIDMTLTSHSGQKISLKLKIVFHK